ncbi:MAG TPA: electron transfer flavoprotein subunit beta/FixA family protein [Anaerolineales bacterium]|nr:electron transfer flavoprotein subunit beta/FixA family protein [Anaerolineales bacterium]
MRILALIKYSMDVAEVKVDPATKELRLAGVPEKIGAIDKNVAEAAVQLKEANGAALQALCLGPLAATDSFKDVLAMGLDEVFLVEDPFAGAADGRVAACILEAAIRKLGQFDLILCGFASDDGYSYQVAPRLAERLGLPLVSYGRQLKVSDGQLEAERDLEDGLQAVSVSLPALASIAEEAYPPRRTTLMEAIKAKKKPVNVWHVEPDLGLVRNELEKLSSIESSSQVGVMIQRKQRMLKTATLRESADQLIDLLLEEKVLKGGSK